MLEVDALEVDVPGVVETEVAFAVVVGPDVGDDPGAAPTMPVDTRTATV